MTPYYTVMHAFGIMHDKSWGIVGLVLFAMTKSCHFSRSTCRSLRLMSFQEKQEQGYTVSIHNIFTRSKVKGVKMLIFLKIICVHSDEVFKPFWVL